LPFTTRAGLYWIDIADHFITNYGITVVGFLECIVIGYVLGAKKARNYINQVSEMKIGIWWDIFIKFLTPAFLGTSLVFQFVKLIKNGYGGYPIWTTYIGLGFILISVIFAIILAKIKGAV